MKKLLKRINSKFTKYQTLDELTINNVVYRVIDKSNIFFPTKNERALAFKSPEDSRVWFHSKIYISPKKIFQPHGLTFQKIFDCWESVFSLNNALILGCAGCTLPRFLAFRFPKCKTLGVEYSKEFIDLAKKYFFIEEIKDSFTLIEGDAFKFVEEYDFQEKQDVVFVDIFEKNQCPDKVFSESFIKSIFNITSENSLLFFNFIGQEKSVISAFAEKINEPFCKKHIIEKDKKVCLLLAKSQDNEKTEKFIREIKNI